MILIFTIKYDFSTYQVINWLKYYGEKVVRINIDDDLNKFEKITEEGIFFRNMVSGEVVNLSEAKACWWRRGGISERSFTVEKKRRLFEADGMDLSRFITGDANIISKESIRLVEYIYDNIYRNCPVNLGRPTFNLNRLIVLDIAKKNGLVVPDFNIVNSHEQLCKTTETFNGCVTKAIADGLVDVLGNNRFHTYTELVEEDLIEHPTNYTFFPSLLSSLVNKKKEIRTFYIDGDFYSMSINSQLDKQTMIDFRKYNYSVPNKTEPFNLPKEIETKMTSVFKELDLNCGSIDFIHDKNNNYIFLEINPVGQYGMVDRPCNYNLDKKIANYLIHGYTSN
jgi:ATP-GRASP peptide maturase of grasp-with-spasm system